MAPCSGPRLGCCRALVDRVAIAESSFTLPLWACERHTPKMKDNERSVLDLLLFWISIMRCGSVPSLAVNRCGGFLTRTEQNIAELDALASHAACSACTTLILTPSTRLHSLRQPRQPAKNLISPIAHLFPTRATPDAEFYSWIWWRRDNPSPSHVGTAGLYTPTPQTHTLR